MIASQSEHPVSTRVPGGNLLLHTLVVAHRSGMSCLSIATFRQSLKAEKKVFVTVLIVLLLAMLIKHTNVGNRNK